MERTDFTKIEHYISQAGLLFNRLVLVADEGDYCPPLSRSNIFPRRWPAISLGIRLSEQLLDLSGRQRVFRVGRLVEEMVSESRGDVVVLDHLDLLFTTELAQDPLLLLQKLGRATNRTMVAVWPGRFEGEALVHAEPGHREYRRYTRPECIVISLSEAAVAP